MRSQLWLGLSVLSVMVLMASPQAVDFNLPVNPFGATVQYVGLHREWKVDLLLESFRFDQASCDKWTIHLLLRTAHRQADPYDNFTSVCDVCAPPISSEEPQVQCQVVVPSIVVGPQYHAQARLIDSSDNAVSVSDRTVWIRGVQVKPNLNPPDCWKMDLPLYLQSEECVWLWKSLRVDAPVYLSQQELGLPGIHSGTWAPHLDSFGGENLDEDISSILPPVGYVIDKFKTCAVVGNAWHLLEGEFGDEINQHDVILRMNQAPLKNFESNVGNRTTHRVVNSGVDTTDIDLDETLIFRVVSRADFKRFVEERKKRGNTYAISPSFLDYGHSTFLETSYNTLSFRMTAGFLALLWAVHSCERIDTYGFGGGISPQELDKGDTMYSYFGIILGPKNEEGTSSIELSTRLGQVFGPWHTWDDENIAHNKFEKAGKVRRRFAPGLQDLRWQQLEDQNSIYKPSQYQQYPYRLDHDKQCSVQEPSVS